MGRKRKLRSRSNLIVEKGADQFRREQNEWKLKSRNKLIIEKGAEQIRREENERKLKSRNKMMVEKGPVNIRKEENERKLKSRKHKLGDDPQQLQIDRKRETDFPYKNGEKRMLTMSKKTK